MVAKTTLENVDPSLLTATSEIEFLHDVTAVRRKLIGSKPFYVYVLCRPDFSPFYVGKGVGIRVLNHESEARNTSRLSHKLNVIRSIHRKGANVVYRLDSFYDYEKEALARERELIARIGRHDLGRGPLTNQTDGGEGVSNPSKESRERRAATLGGSSNDPDRRAVNEFFASIAGPQASVPIKPLGARRLEFTTPHPSGRSPSQRMAVVLVAAALASETQIYPGATVPRMFSLDGRAAVIENGVSRDMLKAGMIELAATVPEPKDEIFAITQSGEEAIRRFIGADKLVDLGVIDEES